MSDTHFKILIAGTVVEIISNYDCVHEFCKDYLTEAKPDFSLTVTQNDIDYERHRDDKSKGSGQGRIPEDYPDSYLEVLSCYRKIAEEMLCRDILLMHGAAIAFDGQGVMFIAESGTGKSTHAGIWKRCFKDRIVLINDDKPLVKITNKSIFVCGTPWSGKKGLNTPIDVPLKAVYKLEQVVQQNRSDPSTPEVCIGKNRVYPLSYDEKWKIMTSQSYKSNDPLRLIHGIELTDRIIQQVPVKKLICDMSNDAALAAYEGVWGGNIY